jgi:hypothetical protein
MKSKFQNFDFGSVEVLSRDEQNKVKGGAYGAGSNNATGSWYGSTISYQCSCNVDFDSSSWNINVPFSQWNMAATFPDAEALAICKSQQQGRLFCNVGYVSAHRN